MARFNFADAGVYCVQQTISGTGTFNGTPVGYASYSYSSGGVTFKVRNPFLGADGNNVKIELVAPTSNALATVAEYDAAMRTLRVFLRGTATTISATAQEVANAINGMERPVLYAGVTANGTVTAVAATNLSGGLDPDTSASWAFPKFAPAANTNGGLFLFDQTRPWKVLGVGGNLSANQNPVTIELVNVDKALNVLPGRVMLSSQNVNNTNHVIDGSRLDFPIMPGQAILVNCGTHQGTVFVYGTAIAALDNIAD